MRHLLLMVLLAAMWLATAAASAPEPPQNVSAAVNGNTVVLTWQAPTTGSAPLGYLVEASLSPGGASLAAFLVVDPSITLAGVPAGVYFARVRSGNAEGISAATNEVMVSVQGGGGCTQPPNPPTGLIASVLDMLVTLNWGPPAGWCTATGYVVQVGSAPAASDVASFNAGNTTSLSVSAPPGAYFVRVVAVNTFGQSAASNELTGVLGDLTGLWSGTSDYINAPFQFQLLQRDRLLSGAYQDQHDSGSAFGQISGNRIRLDVNFGDTGNRFEGTIESADLIRGTLYVPLLGRSFTFQMTR